MLLEAVIAHPLDVLLRHDPARAADQRPVEGHEVGPRLVQVEAHPVGIDDRHLPDLVVEDLRSLGPLEAEPHVLGGERVAVVELQALAELELVDALIRAHRPRLGEAGRHQVAGHGFDERVVDGIEHPERGEARELSRIEPHGRQRHVQRPAHLPFRLRLGGRLLAGATHEHEAKQGGGQREPSGDTRFGVHAVLLRPVVLSIPPHRMAGILTSRAVVRKTHHDVSG